MGVGGEGKGQTCVLLDPVFRLEGDLALAGVAAPPARRHTTRRQGRPAENSGAESQSGRRALANSGSPGPQAPLATAGGQGPLSPEKDPS